LTRVFDRGQRPNEKEKRGEGGASYPDTGGKESSSLPHSATWFNWEDDRKGKEKAYKRKRKKPAIESLGHLQSPNNRSSNQVETRPRESGNKTLLGNVYVSSGK